MDSSITAGSSASNSIEKLAVSERLQSNSFGWFGQLLQSVAHMAPAIAVIQTLPYMASRAGSASPLAMAFGGVLALCIAYSLSNLTKKFYGASGYFQIHSRALGSTVGFTTSWLFLIYEPLNLFSTSMGFGVLILEPFSAAYLGIHIAWWWAPIITNAIVTVLCLTNIRKSITWTGTLAAIEILFMIVLGVVLLHKSPAPIQPHLFFPSMSATGVGGLLFAFIFGFLAFVGFESGLPLTEETKDTTTQTSKGLMISVIFAAVFFIFAAYAVVVGFGGSANSASFAQAFGSAANPFGTLAQKAFGAVGPWLLFLAAANSTIACSLAGANSATRVIFALGRAKIFPSWLGKTTDKNKIPARSVLAGSAISLLLTLIGYFVVKGGNPIDWFGFVGLMLTLPLLVIHFVTCVSVFVAYKGTPEFSFFKHGLMPLITGILVLLPIWGSIYYNLQPPFSYAPYITVAWFVIGLVIYFRLRSKQPTTLKRLESEMDLLPING